MLKYVIKNIKVDGEVLDLYARAEAEDVTYYIPKESGGYESKSLQTVLSQVEADIKKLKKDIEQIEIGGSTIVQPIEYGGTGADNVVKANQNLKSAFLSSVPWGIESFSVVGLNNIDYSLPDGTYRFNGGDFPTVTINVQPVDAYSGQALTTTPWTVEVPAYSIVNIVHSDGNTASLSTMPDNMNDFGYHKAFLQTVEISNIVENYAVPESMEVYAFVYGDSITVDFPMEKLEGITYSVSWYAETAYGSNEYVLTNIKSPNPEIRGGDGFAINQLVNVTDSDKVLNSDYTFDEDNTENVTSIYLTTNESTNALKLYFNKKPDPVYADVNIKIYDGDTGEELTGDFKVKKTTLEGTEVIVTETYPKIITGFELGNFITFTAASSITKEVEDGDDLIYNFDSEDERNVTAITIQEDSSQNIIKFYYKLKPSVTTYTIKYITDSGALVPTVLLNPNTITKSGNVGDTVSLTTEESTKTVNGYLPRSVSNPIVLVKDATQNVLNVVYPFAAIERNVTIHYVIKEVEDVELTGEYDRVIYNAENDTISKIDTVTLPWTRNCVIGDTLPISTFSYVFTQDNITLYSIDGSDTDNSTEWTVPVTGDLTLYYEVTTVTNLPETVLMEPEALMMALGMELDTNDSLISPHAPDSPYASVPYDDTGIYSSDLIYGKLFVMSQQYTIEANDVLGIHLFVGKIDPGDGTEKDAILFRCFDKHDYVGNPMGIPWTSLSDSGIDEVTPDIINGVIPISKGGTGVSDVTDIGDALKVLSLDSRKIITTYDLDTIKEPGMYYCSSESTNKPTELNAFGLLIVIKYETTYPKQWFISGSTIYHRSWETGAIVNGGVSTPFEKYGDWKLVSVPNIIDASRLVMYGKCDTAANVAEKQVSMKSDFKLITGARIAVEFHNASTVSPMTININNTGTHPLRTDAGTTLAGNAPAGLWKADQVVPMCYDGYNWVIEQVKPLATDVTGILPVVNGGTGKSNLIDTKYALYNSSIAAGAFANNNNGSGIHTGSFIRNWFRFDSTNQGIHNSYSLLKLTAKFAFPFKFSLGVSGEQGFDYVQVGIQRSGGTISFTNYKSVNANGDYTEYQANFYLNTGDTVELRYRKDSSGNKGSDLGCFFGFICANEYCNIFRLYDFFSIENGSPTHGANTSASPSIFPFTITYHHNNITVFDIDNKGNMINQAYGYTVEFEQTDNILINPYFLNPVNQRGYPASGANWSGNYFIDRWQFFNNSAAGSVYPALEADGLHFFWGNATGKFVWDIRQPLTPAQKNQLFNMRRVLLYTSVRWEVNGQSTDGTPNDFFYVQLANETKNDYPGQSFFIINNFNPNSIIYWTVVNVPYNWEATDYIRFTVGAHFTQGHIKIQECGITSYSCPTTKWQGENTYQQELKKCYETYQEHSVDLVGLRFPNEDTRCSVPVYPMRTIPAITWGGDLQIIEQTDKYTNYKLKITNSVYRNQGSSVKINTTDVFANDGVTKVTPSEILAFGTRNSVLTLNAEV